MKYHSVILVLSALVCLTSIAKADPVSFQKNLESKVNISDADSIVERANKNYNSVSSPYSEIFQNPLINSTLNDYGNMLQGVTGGGYSQDEMSKQQLDYARQQMENSKDSDNE